MDITISRYVSRTIYALVENKYNPMFCRDLYAGMVFDVDGQIYPCNRLIKKCDYDDEKLKQCNLKNSQPCTECWARGICNFCTATIYLKGITPYNADLSCEHQELYAYAMQSLLNILHNDIQKFQTIIDNFYT